MIWCCLCLCVMLQKYRWCPLLPRRNVEATLWLCFCNVHCYHFSLFFTFDSIQSLFLDLPTRISPWVCFLNSNMLEELNSVCAFRLVADADLRRPCAGVATDIGPNTRGGAMLRASGAPLFYIVQSLKHQPSCWTSVTKDRITRCGEEVKTQQNYTEQHRRHSNRYPKCSWVPQEICAWEVDKWHAKYTDALVPWLKDQSDLKVWWNQDLEESKRISTKPSPVENFILWTWPHFWPFPLTAATPFDISFSLALGTTFVMGCVEPSTLNFPDHTCYTTPSGHGNLSSADHPVLVIYLHIIRTYFTFSP